MNCETAENNLRNRTGGRLSRRIRESLFSEVVTLSCDKLFALCRDRKKISYNCHAVVLKPVQKLFPSWGKREATERGCRAFQQPRSNQERLQSLPAIVVILGASVSTWLSVACKHKNEVALMKIYSCVHYVRRSMK